MTGGTAQVATGSRLSLDYCGEWFHVEAGETFTVGREGDLQVDDNPFLHRRLLVFEEIDGLWWVANTGSRLSATVCDASTGAQSWLPPGARLPIVFAVTTVVFTAGPTTYELLVHVDRPTYTEPPRDPVGGETTIGTVQLTVSQRQLIVSLAEPMLRREGSTVSEIPTNADAAARLGWAITRFNRKLDNVCDKLDKQGVAGLRGGPGKLASNRRTRLVEYAVGSRLVTPEDLVLLDLPEGDLP
ncbi:MAG: hypothetical protein GX593_04050 [Actinomycetales bacterium]|nr:hypothetical protein [Actinomycetales bacterium]